MKRMLIVEENDDPKGMYNTLQDADIVMTHTGAIIKNRYGSTETKPIKKFVLSLLLNLLLQGVKHE